MYVDEHHTELIALVPDQRDPRGGRGVQPAGEDGDAPPAAIDAASTSAA